MHKAVSNHPPGPGSTGCCSYLSWLCTWHPGPAVKHTTAKLSSTAPAILMGSCCLQSLNLERIMLLHSFMTFHFIEQWPCFLILECELLQPGDHGAPQSRCYSLGFFKINLFIYFWLCWVFAAARRLSLVAASGSYSSLQCVGFSLRWLLIAEHGL